MAHEKKIREPDAWTVASHNNSGIVSMRTIFPVHLDGEKMWCATHICSRKSLDFCATKTASCHIYWRELGRQVSLTGDVALLPDHVAEQIWQSRSAAYDPVSIVSHQSKPLHDFHAMLTSILELQNTGKLPRPERFVVWEITFNSYEFWSAAASRIHKRLFYTRTDDGWKYEKLQP
ncbi:pyridoxine 5'-phosphate oxidase C-terminal domain-containing protein [Bartonella queenslandensis]|uniref:pyridoxine 5'-phosphate oxidase C-terminal domain-containing protein n=1 Tax=Bartonella queenslandensis TaxID=481138 RepID=UPI001BA8EC48|nr:pyridoxine 5'-phosphate oxidase C-terminal domain-containing protein [Bartonella queenslandensis]